MQIHNTILIICLIIPASGCTGLQKKQNEQVNPFNVQGWGGTLCTEMLSDINSANGGTKAGQNIGLYQSWISGFVSGINYADDSIYDVSGDTSPNDSFEWVKNYCIKNPDESVPTALHELVIQWEIDGKVLTQAKE